MAEIRTANDVFALGLALLQDRVGDDPDATYFTPYILNIVLQECLPYENQWREKHELEKLEFAPVILSLSEEIPYNESLMRISIPYALASHYYRDNNDQYHEQMFRMMFTSSVNESTPFLIGEVQEVY